MIIANQKFPPEVPSTQTGVRSYLSCSCFLMLCIHVTLVVISCTLSFLPNSYARKQFDQIRPEFLSRNNIEKEIDPVVGVHGLLPNLVE